MFFYDLFIRADLAKTLADIDAFAVKCKFNDCTHTNEANCAVKQAIKDGLTTMLAEVGGMKKSRKLIKNKISRKLAELTTAYLVETELQKSEQPGNGKSALLHIL